MTPVCSITFLSIFLRRDTIVFWKMCLLYWLTNLTHQNHYREKTNREAFCRHWRHGDWTLKIVSQIAFCFILTTGFAETILVPIMNFTIFIFYNCCCRFYYSVLFIVAVSMIVLVFLLSLLLMLVWWPPLLLWFL